MLTTITRTTPSGSASRCACALPACARDASEVIAGVPPADGEALPAVFRIAHQPAPGRNQLSRKPAVSEFRSTHIRTGGRPPAPMGTAPALLQSCVVVPRPA